MAATIDGSNYSFGGLVLTINTEEYLFQEISVSEGTNVIELEGSDGDIISQVFVGRPREASGTAVVENDTPLLKRGDEFSFKVHATETSDTTFLVTETSITKSNGAFSTQSFSARAKLN
tara:strand:- start:1284 stop:1640 length:357 start_codon:yes stop_codon:yes gene_type:complete